MTPDQQLAIFRSALCKRSFYDFIRLVRPGYEFNWHHLELIEAMQRLADRRMSRLIVQMPPRHGKSEIVSRLFPAWLLARNPNEQVIACSYAADLAEKMSRDCQRIMTSPRYTNIFPEIGIGEIQQVGVVRTNKRFDIPNHKGYYVSAGVSGAITGEGCTVGIIDDPVKNAEEADSPTYRERAWNWYRSTFKTRFEPGAVEVICQTRWHEDDLAGRIIKDSAERGGEGTEIISFPALCMDPEYIRDIGEALWEGRYDRAALLKIQQDVGSRSWNALYQQRPSPDEGTDLKKSWFRYYDPRTFVIPPTARVNFFFDTAYTDKDKNDPTAGIAYVKIGADFYVLSCLSKWVEFTEAIQFIKTFAAENFYTPRSIIRIEPKASGKSVVQVMKKQTSLNVTDALSPKESKQARVRSISPTVEGGRVFLPSGAAWVDDFLTECAAFPNAAHDDRVDCLTGMILNESAVRVRRSS